MSPPSHKIVSRERALRILDGRISQLQDLAKEHNLELSEDTLRKQLSSILIRGLEKRHTIAEDEILRILKDANATSPDTALTTAQIRRKLRLPTSPLTILKLMEERGELRSIKGGRPFRLVRDDATSRLVGGEAASKLLYSRIQELARLASTNPAARRHLRKTARGITDFDPVALRDIVDLETYNILVEELHRNELGLSLRRLTPVWLATSSKWWLPESR